jgi:hypothetical protein
MNVFQIVAALVRSFVANRAELAAENLGLGQQLSEDGPLPDGRGSDPKC